jgi:plastocyanin
MLSSTRSKVLLASAAVLVTAPALAHGQGVPPSTASYTASDSATASRDTYRWYVNGSTETDVTILQGGTVSFSNPPGAARPHNVDFTGEVKPQCQLSTSDTPSTAPMPAAAARAWSGTCTFAQPGAYRFVCDLHPAMAGTITVSATPETTAVPVPTSAPAPAPSVPAQPVIQPRAAIWITVGHHQHGTSVRGSMIVSRPGTRVEIALLSRRVALGLKGKRRVQVGRTLIAAAPKGELQFSLALNATARRALRVRKTLPVLVRVKASAPTTTPVERVQAVRLGRPARGR